MNLWLEYNAIWSWIGKQNCIIRDICKKEQYMRKEYKYFEGKTTKNCEDRRTYPDPK